VRFVLFSIVVLAAGAAFAQAQAPAPLQGHLTGPVQPLAKYTIVGNTIPEPLTAQPGDPVRGRRVVTDASNSTCLICHEVPALPEFPDQGKIAPPLEGLGTRYTAAELRLRLVNPKLVTPDTMMPAYYRTEGLTRVQQQFVGRTIYSAQDIEDAIAFLMTIK
jgi:sulfur-oxidizing protein SoxX